MKELYLKFPVVLSLLVCVFSVLFLIFTAEKAPSTVWKDYRILCVSPADREADLLSVLHAAGVSGYVTQSNSAFLPCQNLTPVISFLPEAEVERSRWFFDRENTHRIVYIDETRNNVNYEKFLGKLLEAAGFSWFLEKTGVFLPVPVLLLVPFVFSAVCLYPAFPAVLAGSFFPLLFALTRNNFSGWLSAFFYLCATTSFCASVFLPRVITTVSQRMEFCKKNVFFFLPWFCAALVPYFTSGVRFFSVLLVPAGTVALLFLLNFFSPAVFSFDSPLFSFKNRKRLHPVFRAVVMKNPAGGMVFFGKKMPDPKVFLFQLVWAVVLIPVSLFVFSFGGKNGDIYPDNKKNSEYFTEKNEKNGVYALYIPAPEMYTSGTGFSPDTFEETVLAGFFSGYTDTGFSGENTVFSLSDFVALQWNVSAYPWRKLDSPFEIPKPGSLIKSGEVKKGVDGALSFEETTKAEFNSDFIMNVFEHNASPLEKMLIRQKRFIKAGWTEMPR